MYEWIQWLHLAAGIVWLGGMTLLLWAVRPASIALLPPEQRLPLLQRVLSRFFVLVCTSRPSDAWAALFRSRTGRPQPRPSPRSTLWW